MLEIQIMPLTENFKIPALDIATRAKVGTRFSIIRFFNKVLRLKTKSVFVALHKINIVGVIGWYQDKGGPAKKSLGDLFPTGDDVYWVSYFAIADSVRNNGVGTRLMHKLFTKLKTQKAKELWTYTSRARVFYEKLGFKFRKRAVIEKELHDFLCYSFDKQRRLEEIRGLKNTFIPNERD